MSPSNLIHTNISEEQVIVAFHSFLQGALAQAHAERLLDTSVLSSAEADIQIAGPAICLFLAALRSEGRPPSIATSMICLDANNCPASFRNWFILWSEAVPKIKALPPDLSNDLARMICDQEPQCQPIRIDLPIMARDLKAIAIEISQRRTFQERFSQDLDYALQFGHDTRATPTVVPSSTFRPPPAYEGNATPATIPPTLAPNSGAKLNTSPLSGLDSALENHPALSIIRETLYASLTDILYTTPTVFEILQSRNSTDGQLSRAYFGALCLAILEVSLTLVNPADRQVRVVNLGSGYPSILKVEDCPPHLQPLAAQLFLIASSTQALARDDDESAVESVSHGERTHPTKIDRLKNDLEHGTNWEAGQNPDESHNNRAPSPMGTVRVAANRINTLALGISQIPSFREREEALFEILVPSLSERKKN
ncbi:hypothetical protein MJO28_000322 [Puccinia striiformis f. sp. tritici]|uniref:Uncharacterized protein n=1 Tax=Puccinia striiformis f. sp. tritici TaxID=168172 RepID=A0ACC0F0J2_9BASI|nr:hypothetical protein Pst134EB_002126 [Puccinia striiformis f. sp. tritici]KAI7962228.1 hypothetical protein MJO28_000322 [Puccinia striiformis f. sp. tritici]KAI7967626.1 hypothetical protein MJO29_000903 [Puccinia striiformis f. sp. tritici]KAI9601747.1 hypothetical protein KEM48_000851 [Puccinia striiformis f. sp. tritici PST-130]